MANYGQSLYDVGDPLYMYLETLNAVVDHERSLRRHLQEAWDVGTAWHRLSPAYNRLPTPAPLLLAMTTLAFLWHWWDVAALLLLSFVGMLRPGEALKLIREDIVLPSALLLSRDTFYVRVRDPKMRRTTARREHIRVDEPRLLLFLEAWLPSLPPGRRLFQGSPATFRRCHDALVRFFNVDTREGTGITPASHRAGGATRF